MMEIRTDIHKPTTPDDSFVGTVEFPQLLFPGFLGVQLPPRTRLDDTQTLLIFVDGKNEAEIERRVQEIITRLRTAFSHLSKEEQETEVDTWTWTLSSDYGSIQL